jgi:hypothetical protein
MRTTIVGTKSGSPSAVLSMPASYSLAIAASPEVHADKIADSYGRSMGYEGFAWAPGPEIVRCRELLEKMRSGSATPAEREEYLA